MDNHYHLVIRTTDKPLSALKRPLNGGYARWYNRKHGRRGYLFQDRFKSVLCQDQDYARQLIRYVHLNPVRGGQVMNLAQLRTWKWCGHGFLLGVRTASGANFQNRNEALGRFSENEVSARRAYLEYLADGLKDETPAHAAGLLEAAEATELSGSGRGWPAVIGDPEFARAAMVRHEIGAHRRHRQADYEDVLNRLADQVCREFEITRSDLFKRGRGNIRSRARAQFCRSCHVQELLPFAVIARFLKVTIAAVGSMVKRNA